MEIDPVSLTLKEMLRMDSLALHNLAKKTAGSLTRYRALCGRLLLAIQHTGAYLEHGCSGAVHYAILQLGMPVREARQLKRVARELEALPFLRLRANLGEIDWSKLREVVRVATVDTEQRWAELCKTCTYAEIEALVACCRRGELPSEQLLSRPPRSEFRCTFDPEQMAIIERGLQILCQREGRVIGIADAIELLFAELIADRTVDERLLKKLRLEALKDLRWTDVINAETETLPETKIEIVNPKSRFPTPAQRRQVLRRDGYCCAVPGCPNTIWLDVHHIVYFAAGGLTKSDNLVTLCTKCHKNVHENELKISGDAPHALVFRNRFGQDLRYQRSLDVAFWLDIWCGWRGERRYQRAREREPERLAA